MNARDFLMLPWSIRGPVRVTDDQENVHYELRVAELPDFMVAAAAEGEVLYEFKPALVAFLESYASQREVPPRPLGQRAE